MQVRVVSTVANVARRFSFIGPWGRMKLAKFRDDFMLRASTTDIIRRDDCTARVCSIASCATELSEDQFRECGACSRTTVPKQSVSSAGMHRSAASDHAAKRERSSDTCTDGMEGTGLASELAGTLSVAPE